MMVLPEPTQPSMASPASDRLTVLVVEDEPLVRQVTVQSLIDSGYDVIEAETGDEAVSFLDQGRPVDVLFTDIRMPGTVNGWQVAEAFRAAKPGLPVLYATGHSTLQTPVSGSLFFRKPYKPSQVVWGIRALTASARANEGIA